jgi:O-antigen ligase
MLGLAAAGLIALGWATTVEPLAAAACVGVGILAIAVLVAAHRPRLAMAASFSILLVGGTKFRTRDADASLAGALDAQVVLELALFAVIGAIVLGLWIARRDDRRGLSSTELAVMAYGFLAAASVAWSAAPALTGVRAVQLLIVGLFAILTVRALRPAAAMWFMSRAVTIHVLVFAAIAACSPWAYDGFYSSTDTFDDGFRFRWFSAHPIDAATLAGLGAIGLLGALWFRQRSTIAPPRVRTWLAVAAMVLVLVLTRSRGPMVALAVGAGILWLLRMRPVPRAAALCAGVAAAAATVAFAAEIRTGVEWLSRQDSMLTNAFFRGQTADTVFELNGRLGLWQELQPIVVEHLTLGYGYQASRAVLLAVADWAAYAHNAFLQTALDLGLAGIAIVLWLFAPIVRSLVRPGSDAAVRATVLALTAFLTLNAMSTESFAAVPHFETLLLFVCALAAAADGAGGENGPAPSNGAMEDERP